jgi:lipopolysaccharide transport system ATP-binding protein
MGKIMIEVEGLSKMYRLGKIGSRTFSQDLNEWTKALIGRKRDIFQEQATTSNETDVLWSLRDISFNVREGEVFGIVGKNGAGKSTLLKLLSKITKPTRGIIKLNGNIASLLEVGTGFHPDLSGRENIYLNGAILGMKKNEIKSKFDAIVSFSGIEKFLDTPVKRYSSGMFVRLGFAVAAHLDPDILVVDEVLAVGDYEFQNKCLGKMKEVAKGGRTILFVSHSMAAVKQLCDKAILLNRGRLEAMGTTDEVLQIYQRETLDKDDGIRGSYPGNAEGYFTDWKLEGDSLPSKHSCYSRDTVAFVFGFKTIHPLVNCEARIMIKYESLIVFHGSSIDSTHSLFSIDEGYYEFRFKIDFPIRDAKFDVEVVLFSAGKMVDLWLSSTKFTVLDNYGSRVNAGVLNNIASFSVRQHRMENLLHAI